MQEGGGTAVRVRGLASLGGSQIPHRLVVYAWDGDMDRLRQLAGKLRDSAQLVAVAPRLNLAEQMSLLSEQHCNHVLATDERGLRMLTVTVKKFVSGDLFGIEKYVPQGTEVHLTRLRDYEGRQRAIDEVLEFAERSGVRRPVRQAVAQVCEELLMNALYDAPVDEHGMPIFAEVDTKARLRQLSPRPVSIRYAALDSRFVVAVRDRFGRLDKATILRHIQKCLHSGEQIDRKTYGAGLGLYLIANAAAEYVVNVAPGVATEAVCTFDRNSRQPLHALSMFIYPRPLGPSEQVAPGQGPPQPPAASS